MGSNLLVLYVCAGDGDVEVLNSVWLLVTLFAALTEFIFESLVVFYNLTRFLELKPSSTVITTSTDDWRSLRSAKCGLLLSSCLFNFILNSGDVGDISLLLSGLIVDGNLLGLIVGDLVGDLSLGLCVGDLFLILRSSELSYLLCNFVLSLRI